MRQKLLPNRVNAIPKNLNENECAVLLLVLCSPITNWITIEIPANNRKFSKKIYDNVMVESVENFQFLLQLWRLTDAHLICWFETHQYTSSVVIGPSQGIHWTLCLWFCLFLIDLWIVHCYRLHEPFFSVSEMSASATRDALFTQRVLLCQQHIRASSAYERVNALLHSRVCVFRGFHSISVVVFIWIKCVTFVLAEPS